jgi:hypothetical protein
VRADLHPGLNVSESGAEAEIIYFDLETQVDYAKDFIAHRRFASARGVH